MNPEGLRLIHSSRLVVSGRRGVFTGVSGLQIAYVSGREALQEPAPAHCFTPKDLLALVEPLTSSSKFRGVDILLTSQWPRGVWRYGNNPVSRKSRINSVEDLRRLLRSCASRLSVTGSGHQILRQRLRCHPRRQIETAISLCCAGGCSL